MTTLQSSVIKGRSKIALYIPLIKSLQTGLLLATGIAGYLSAQMPVDLGVFFAMSISLFLAISGSTIMNMWYDHDIDSKMKRTHKRPAASGQLSRTEVFRVGMITSILCIGWAVLCRLVLRRGGLHTLAQAPHLLVHSVGRYFGCHAHPRRARPRRQ
jgi:heme O synthase-like polyprenyltransferase